MQSDFRADLEKTLYQIEVKRHGHQYTTDSHKFFNIGVSFSSKTRHIKNRKIEDRGKWMQST